VAFVTAEFAPSSLPPLTSSRSGAAYDVAAGGLASLAGSLAYGGLVSATWLPRGSGLGAYLSFQGESQHTVDIGTHQAEWRRWLGSIEADARWSVGRSAFDTHGGFAFGWLTATGRGFSSNLPATAFFPGFSLGMRWSWWPASSFGVWLGLSALYVARTQALVAQDAGEREVPSFQGFLSLGVAVGKASAGL
jgi:hypothetical protein